MPITIARAHLIRGCAISLGLALLCFIWAGLHSSARATAYQRFLEVALAVPCAVDKDDPKQLHAAFGKFSLSPWFIQSTVEVSAFNLGLACRTQVADALVGKGVKTSLVYIP